MQLGFMVLDFGGRYLSFWILRIGHRRSHYYCCSRSRLFYDFLPCGDPV